MDEPLAPLHVPQHKLRYTQNDDVLIPHFLSPLQFQPTNTTTSSSSTSSSSLSPNTTTTTTTTQPSLMASTNLSLSSSSSIHANAFLPSPVGPFTGYASVLARSRFLHPARELLLDVSRLTGVSVEKPHGLRILDDSRSFFDDGKFDDVSLRCCNPNLVSLLHQVYKRYKVYCQQMQSAVSSFESVVGLSNAAPFLSFDVRAMFRHFQCLKNAILDQIRVTSNDFCSVETRRSCDSISCSDEKSPTASNFLQPPVWRSQRGFSDKAVGVLRNWLFEHFLHPYPSDSEKQMLAHKTGLSRSQVSNWFTNARVRLWKPMVEEMHALERKSQCSKPADTPKFFTVSSDNQTSLLFEKNFQITYSHNEHNTNTQGKCTRIDAFHGSKEQFGMLCEPLPRNQVLHVGACSQNGAHFGHGSTLGNDQDNTTGLSWQSHGHGQIVPFWLAK